MAKAQEGKTVKVHYTGKLKDGTVFDTSREREEPISFEVGGEQVIPGFENAVEGMKPGDEKTVTIEPDEGYGERREDLVFEIESENVSGQPEVGQQLQIKHPSGQMIPVTVVEVDDNAVTVDANHALAGKTLVFEIELVGVDEAEGDSQIITP